MFHQYVPFEQSDFQIEIQIQIQASLKHCCIFKGFS